jgi:4-hydroxy-2-oxoglutarate aldolase
MTPLSGQFPPIPTPFEGGRVSGAKLAENIARWNEKPLAGYVVLGSNGEAPLLEDDERREVLRAARRAIPQGKRLLIAGTGRESTVAAVRATKEAFDLGADAVIVGVPHYYKPQYTAAVLEAHLRAVADAAAGPILLYSVPQFTGVPVPPAVAEALASHPRVAGIKDSGGDLGALRTLLDVGRRAGKPFAVLVGSARVWASGLLAGAAGGVLAVAAVAPDLCAEIAALARRGDDAAALAAGERLGPLAAAVTRVHGIGGLKAALDLLHYHGGDPRPPLAPATPAARLEIAAHLRSLGLLT